MKRLKVAKENSERERKENVRGKNPKGMLRL